MVVLAQLPPGRRATILRTMAGAPPEVANRLRRPTVIALLTYFMFALQCMSTIAVMRRETNSWRWPAFAFSYMFVLAWVMAFTAHSIAIGLGA